MFIGHYSSKHPTGRCRKSSRLRPCEGCGPRATSRRFALTSPRSNFCMRPPPSSARAARTRSRSNGPRPIAGGNSSGPSDLPNNSPRLLACSPSREYTLNGVAPSIAFGALDSKSAPCRLQVIPSSPSQTTPSIRRFPCRTTHRTCPTNTPTHEKGPAVQASAHAPYFSNNVFGSPSNSDRLEEAGRIPPVAARDPSAAA